ncbi:MAG: 2-oxo acid dehydrogenase subunit E2, partial [Bradymonadaceae bacterium]
MMSKYWNKPPRVSSWRKISVGMWKPPSDPTIYGYENIDIDSLLDYLDEVSEACGEKITLTAYVVKALGDTLAQSPDLNAIVIQNQVLRRENTDIFVQVAIPNDKSGQADLSGVKLRNVDGLDAVQIAGYLRGRANKVRKGEDAEIEQTKSMIDKIPPLLMPSMLRVVDLLTYVVPLDLDKLGIRSDPFGSAMVTNVGNFDVRHGFAPLVPMSRCPLVLLLGAVTEEPFAYDGEVVARRAVNMCLTCD